MGHVTWKLGHNVSYFRCIEGKNLVYLDEKLGNLPLYIVYLANEGVTLPLHLDEGVTLRLHIWTKKEKRYPCISGQRRSNLPLCI